MWDHVVFGRELPQKKVNKNPEEIKKQAYGFKKTFQHNNFEDVSLMHTQLYYNIKLQLQFLTIFYNVVL